MRHDGWAPIVCLALISIALVCCSPTSPRALQSPVETDWFCLRVTDPSVCLARARDDQDAVQRLLKQTRNARNDTWKQTRERTRPPIGFVVSRFGRLPQWLPASLRTFGTNQGLVDVHLITDTQRAKFPGSLPPNCHIHFMQLHQFTDLIHAQTGIKPNIRIPYKLSDFKPAYGQILKDILQPYMFWAYGDFDVLWGNLSRFITRQALKDFDVIFPSPTLATSHLAFMRNNERMRNLWQQIPDVRRKLASPVQYYIDESPRTFFPTQPNPGIGFADLVYQHANHSVRPLMVLKGNVGVLDCLPFNTSIWQFPHRTNMQQYCLSATMMWNSKGLLHWDPAKQSCIEFGYYHFMFWKREMVKSWDGEVLRIPSLHVNPAGHFSSLRSIQQGGSG